MRPAIRPHSAVTALHLCPAFPPSSTPPADLPAAPAAHAARCPPPPPPAHPGAARAEQAAAAAPSPAATGPPPHRWLPCQAPGRVRPTEEALGEGGPGGQGRGRMTRLTAEAGPCRLLAGPSVLRPGPNLYQPSQENPCTPSHPMALVRRRLLPAMSSSAQAASPASGQSPASSAERSVATTAAGTPCASICRPGGIGADHTHQRVLELNS